ncbi:MAG: VOC family protein [Capsulimonas sp.]|uniref:VOC family protein n=1 Tax=Capsulimonas sp. TaxID=2494211 RepID=UPI00326576E8
MSVNVQFKRVSPMLGVSDMEKTLAFYTTVLLFDIAMQSPGYSIVEKNGASVHFSLVQDETILKGLRGHTEIYIEVEGIDALWEHVAQFKGQYRIRDLFTQSYGMREFHIDDPNECLVFVGQRA